MYAEKALVTTASMLKKHSIWFQHKNYTVPSTWKVQLPLLKTCPVTEDLFFVQDNWREILAWKWGCVLDNVN